MCDMREVYKDEGIEEGIKKGREEGISNLVKAFLDTNISESYVISKLIELYNLTSEQAKEYLAKYSNCI